MQGLRAYCREQFAAYFKVEWDDEDGHLIFGDDAPMSDERAELDNPHDWDLRPPALARFQSAQAQNEALLRERRASVMTTLRTLRSAVDQLEAARVGALRTMEELRTERLSDEEANRIGLPVLARVLALLPGVSPQIDAALPERGRAGSIYDRVRRAVPLLKLPSPVGPRELVWIRVLAGPPVRIEDGEKVRDVLTRERGACAKADERRRARTPHNDD